MGKTKFKWLTIGPLAPDSSCSVRVVIVRDSSIAESDLTRVRRSVKGSRTARPSQRRVRRTWVEFWHSSSTFFTDKEQKCKVKTSQDVKNKCLCKPKSKVVFADKNEQNKLKPEIKGHLTRFLLSVTFEAIEYETICFSALHRLLVRPTYLAENFWLWRNQILGFR